MLLASVAVPSIHAEQKEPFVTAIASTKRAVGLVGCFTRTAEGTGTLIAAQGSAFFVSATGEFVTAAHVITNLPSGARCPVAGVYLPIGGWQQTAAKFQVLAFPFVRNECRVDPHADIAVCRTVDEPSSKRGQGVVIEPVVLDSDLPPDGTAVAFTGFPLDALMPLTSRGAIASYRTFGDTGRTEMILDKSAWPGASGSPVFLSNGHVVGMIVRAGVNAGAGLAYAATAAAIHDVRGRASTR
jgi:V8-like Glu-specific endopeptidase